MSGARDLMVRIYFHLNPSPSLGHKAVSDIRAGCPGIFPLNPSHDHRTEDLLILNLNPSESISQSYTQWVVVHLALDLEHICGFSIRSITVGHFGSLPSSHLIPSELNPYGSFGIFVSGSFGRWVLYAVVGHFKAVGHFGSLPRNLPSRIFPTLSLYSLFKVCRSRS